MDIFFKIGEKDAFKKHHHKRMEILCCEFRIINVYNVLHEQITKLHHYINNYNCIQLETPSVDIPLLNYLGGIYEKIPYGKFLTPPNFKHIANCNLNQLVDFTALV